MIKAPDEPHVGPMNLAIRDAMADEALCLISSHGIETRDVCDVMFPTVEQWKGIIKCGHVQTWMSVVIISVVHTFAVFSPISFMVYKG